MTSILSSSANNRSLSSGETSSLTNIQDSTTSNSTNSSNSETNTHAMNLHYIRTNDLFAQPSNLVIPAIPTGLNLDSNNNWTQPLASPGNNLLSMALQSPLTFSIPNTPNANMNTMRQQYELMSGLQQYLDNNQTEEKTKTDTQLFSSTEKEEPPPVINDIHALLQPSMVNNLPGINPAMLQNLQQQVPSVPDLNAEMPMYGMNINQLGFDCNFNWDALLGNNVYEYTQQNQFLPQPQAPELYTNSNSNLNSNLNTNEFSLPPVVKTEHVVELDVAPIKKKKRGRKRKIKEEDEDYDSGDFVEEKKKSRKKKKLNLADTINENLNTVQSTFVGIRTKFGTAEVPVPAPDVVEYELYGDTCIDRIEDILQAKKRIRYVRGLSDTQKKDRRREQNRNAAARSRARKNAMIKKVIQLHTQNIAFRDYIANNIKRVNEMTDENIRLREQCLMIQPITANSANGDADADTKK